MLSSDGKKISDRVTSSPDLNPLDDAFWGVLEAATNKTPHPSIDALKAAITRKWNNLPNDFIISSCRNFRRRVQAVIGHIGC